MPRHFLFTKKEIIDASISIVRERGIKAVTARELSKVLHSSSKPIFSIFKNMDEVISETIAEAYRLYNKYIFDAMKSGTWPEYKASGMAYISFAREERELFKLLFMRDRSKEIIPPLNFSPFSEIIEKNLGITKKEAERFHLEMWITVHGIASMINTSFLTMAEKDISGLLTDCYFGLRERFIERRKNESN